MKNKKSLGQNWLKNREILEEIAETAKWGAGRRCGGDGKNELGNYEVRSLGEAELCLEIGPGLGTLTSSLLKRFARVVAVEKDEELARKLPASFPGKNLRVVTGDILEFDFGEFERREFGGDTDIIGEGDDGRAGSTGGAEDTIVEDDGIKTGLADEAESVGADPTGETGGRNSFGASAMVQEKVFGETKTPADAPKLPYAVVGNIPYYLTSVLIRKLLTETRAERVVLLVQKEVADRVAGRRDLPENPANHASLDSRRAGATRPPATPQRGGKQNRSFLSLFVENYADAHLGRKVGREEFTPAPKVDSRVLVLETHAPKVTPTVLALARIGFANPRKKLVRNLSVGLGVTKSEILAVLPDPNVRAGELGLAEWEELWKILKAQKII